ncbi:MAG TPA: helix-turn-helix domain-containing protein [Gemmataceae bacterium]|nr:helix-turn-helix domain-containing protein [Gemmataceae bacterium]
MSAATLPNVMTSDDVSLWLRLPTRTVERMARRGEVPCRRLPTGDLVFDAAILADWLRQLPDGKGAAHAP